MKQLTAADLEELSEGMAVPFLLSLPEGTANRTWHCQAVLRRLPGRRLVLLARPVSARAAGSPAAGLPARILKLFFGRAHRRYFERERRGLAWLAAAGMPVAGICGEVRAHDLSGLIIEYLHGAQDVPAHDQAALERVAALLGRMHAAGLWQADLHLENFLLCDGDLYAIDGDAVKRRADAVSLAHGLADLATLAAQRPPREDDRAAGLLAAYAGARNLADVPTEMEFGAKLRRARRSRANRYLKKSLRNCSEFALSADAEFRYLALRGLGQRVLEQLRLDGRLQRGEGFLAAEAVKLGNSATLVRAEATVPVIIKRYNIKNVQQGVRRMLRPRPRYRRAWMMGQLMHLLDLPTARPLALVEERRGMLPGVAYLVMEDVGGLDLAMEAATEGLSAARIDQVTALFVELARAGLTHGDTKASNFLVRGGQVRLVDLDAMRLGRRGFDRDLARFLDNWNGNERDAFQAAFRGAGLL